MYKKSEEGRTETWVLLMLKYEKYIKYAGHVYILTLYEVYYIFLRVLYMFFFNIKTMEKLFFLARRRKFMPNIW